MLMTRHELDMLPLPPAMGTRHTIRPFLEDVRITEELIGEIGYLVDEKHEVKADPFGYPKQFFSRMTVALPSHTDPDYTLQIGLRGSYDESIARGIAVGSHVIVCSNLCFFGESMAKTKQSTNIGDRIMPLFRDAVQRIPEISEQQDQFFSRLKNTILPKKDGDSFLVELVRRKVLTGSQLTKALVQWDKPDHEEHQAEGRTAWLLHNAVTEAMKGNTDLSTWRRSSNLTQMLQEVYA